MCFGQASALLDKLAELKAELDRSEAATGLLDHKVAEAQQESVDLMRDLHQTEARHAELEFKPAPYYLYR